MTGGEQRQSSSGRQLHTLGWKGERVQGCTLQNLELFPTYADTAQCRLCGDISMPESQNLLVFSLHNHCKQSRKHWSWWGKALDLHEYYIFTVRMPCWDSNWRKVLIKTPRPAAPSETAFKCNHWAQCNQDRAILIPWLQFASREDFIE